MFENTKLVSGTKIMWMITGIVKVLKNSDLETVSIFVCPFVCTKFKDNLNKYAFVFLSQWASNLPAYKGYVYTVISSHQCKLWILSNWDKNFLISKVHNYYE